MQNSRFAVAIHTLVLLAAKVGKPTSSDYIAGSVGTNPVLIRRLMGDLRAAGIVGSRAGATGGFSMDSLREDRKGQRPGGGRPGGGRTGGAGRKPGGGGGPRGK